MNNKDAKDNNSSKKPEYIPLSKAVELTSIPNGTLKRYMLNHSQFVDFKKVGREYRININDLEIIKIIRTLYNQGLKQNAVDEKLESEGIPVTITIPEENNSSLVNVNEELSQLKNMVQLNNNVQEKLISELMELKQEINRKDATILNFMKESMESRKEIASALEEINHSKKWWQFWK